MSEGVSDVGVVAAIGAVVLLIWVVVVKIARALGVRR